MRQQKRIAVSHCNILGQVGGREVPIAKHRPRGAVLLPKMLPTTQICVVMERALKAQLADLEVKILVPNGGLRQVS